MEHVPSPLGLIALLASFFEQDEITIYHGDCREILPQLSGYDSVVTDPPYPEIDRDYGRFTETEWHEMMRSVVVDVRQGLKTTGSAVFILQPNSERVGRMRPWLWEFMAWTAREWNQVQDAYWWNTTAMPTVHCSRDNGLMRPSIKPCVWLGDEKCYRNQAAVLWKVGDSTLAINLEDRALAYRNSGMSVRTGRLAATAIERGGSTPFNVLPMAHNGANHGGCKEHGAATPRDLMDWWVSYITPDGGTVVDPFCGSGTMLAVARDQGLRAIGIEKEEKYCEIAVARMKQRVLFPAG